MDDFSKIQKINTVARELMKHGQASSMDEAIRMATRQVESGDIPQYLPGDAAPTKNAEALPELKETVELPREGVSNDDIMRAVERLVSAQQTAVSRMTNVVNAHTSQLQVLNEKINGLIGEMSAIKDDVRRMKESPVAPPMKQKDVKQGQTQFKPGSEIPSTSVRPPVEASSGHARTGNFKPDDVSIEKFFYYGKR